MDIDKLIDKAFVRHKEQEQFTFHTLVEMVEQVMGEQTTLTEGKLNEGDVVEGIFAIAVALNIAYDAVEPSLVEKWRKKIEPALYRKERQVIVISDHSDMKTKDRIKVVLEMRLKSPKTVGGSFGAEYDSMNDVPSIAKKQASLLKQIDSSSALKKIRSFKESILTNGKRDAVVFTVIADGLEGETAEGNLKGDVMLKVQASESAQGELEDTVGAEVQEVAFSLKSNSKTVANLSIYKGLIALAESWGIQGFSSQVERFAALTDRKTDKVAKAKLLAEMFTAFANELDKIDKTPEFSAKVVEFLSGAIFGDDMADVVDITKSGIHEVTKENFDKLIGEGMTFDVIVGKQSNGNPIINFFRTGSGGKNKADKLFHLRTKIRVDENGGLKEAKLYPELGPLAYAVEEEQEQ